MDISAVVGWAHVAPDSHGTDPAAPVDTGDLEILLRAFDARAVLLLSPPTAPDEPAVVLAGAGDPAVRAELLAAATTPAPTGLSRPAAGVALWPVPGVGVLALRHAADDTADDELTLGLTLVGTALAARVARRALDDAVAHNDHAQQLAGMGDFDWHIASDTTRWSANMYRIYGLEPGEFVPDYDRFVSMVHPDDRQRIVAIHQAALTARKQFATTERIVRPTGEIRYLHSSGDIVVDAAGNPERIRGTCVDVTDRVRAEHDRQRSGARFRGLVEACPDAILVLEGDTVVMANRRAHELLAGDPVGRLLGDIVTGEGAGIGNRTAAAATGLDGAPLVLDVSTTELNGDQRLTALYLRDAGPRLRSETVASTLREATLRRAQALELNDAVVQGLTASLMSMQGGDIAECEIYLQRTLESARQMMNDWLEPLGGQDLRPGDLVRSTESVLAQHPTAGPAGAPEPTRFAPREVPDTLPSARSAPRIVIVDDNDDVRRLLRIQIERLKTYAVIGEAADGAEAIEVAAKTQPDVVFLDMAMPHMDGLEALPHILKASPESRVVVLSGFDESSMAPKALAAGASRYLEKGLRLNFREIIDDVMSAA